MRSAIINHIPFFSFRLEQLSEDKFLGSPHQWMQLATGQPEENFVFHALILKQHAKTILKCSSTTASQSRLSFPETGRNSFGF
jgi:hypothetical protein